MTGASATANMQGLDFDNFWTATDEYPVLSWQVADVTIEADESSVGEGQTTGVTVTLSLNDGTEVTASEVAEYDSGGIVTVAGGVVDAEQQGTTEITATVEGHSDSTELEIVEPPRIGLEDTTLDADAVVDDSSLTATATYENDGGPGSHTAELIADGQVVHSETFSLDADEGATIEFEWTPDGAVGTEYDLAIDDTDLGSIDVVEPGTVSLEDARFPDRVGSGAPYEFPVDLENELDRTVSETVTYEREGETVATVPVAVDPDGSTAILGHETDTDVGLTIAHAVSLGEETIDGTSTVTEPPKFEIAAIETPDEVEPEDDFEVSIEIENTGGVEGTQTVSVTHDERTVASEEVTIGDETTETITLSLEESEPGTYEYDVATTDEETAASVTVAEPEDGAEETDEANDSDGLPGFGGTAAAVAVLAIALSFGSPNRQRRSDRSVRSSSN